MQTLVIGAIAVLVGVLLGFWLGKSSSHAESGLLREQIKGLEMEKASQAAELKALQTDITRLTGELGTAQASLSAEISKYAQMKADLDMAFRGAAADALRANTGNPTRQGRLWRLRNSRSKPCSTRSESR